MQTSVANVCEEHEGSNQESWVMTQSEGGSDAWGLGDWGLNYEVETGSSFLLAIGLYWMVQIYLEVQWEIEVLLMLKY